MVTFLFKLTAGIRISYFYVDPQPALVPYIFIQPSQLHDHYFALSAPLHCSLPIFLIEFSWTAQEIILRSGPPTLKTVLFFSQLLCFEGNERETAYLYSIYILLWYSLWLIFQFKDRFEHLLSWAWTSGFTGVLVGYFMQKLCWIFNCYASDRQLSSSSIYWR